LQYLAPYTTSLTDPDSQNILSEAFSNLLLSALATFTPTPLLSVVALSSFLESLLRNAPTSSSSQYPIGLAEISLDAIWALDSQLDEVLQDAKTVLEKTGQDRADTPPDEITAARQAKENMEKDRTVLAEVVKYLAVSKLESDRRLQLIFPSRHALSCRFL
jgi:THO complex subunit 2